MEIKIPGEACPICRKPAREGFKPFCSVRCADIDLGRWLSDRYVIPADDDEDTDGRPAAADDRG